MCGRFALYADYEALLVRFSVGESALDQSSYEANYNVAPYQQIVAIINDGEKNRLGALRWGLIPSWAKDKKIGYKMVNARAETAAEKPSFRHAFKRKRCLIPANAFYEWRKDQSGKTPMLIHLASDELFAFAGLWESWTAPDGELIHSCTILTTQPNALMADIHDRMPVILSKQAEGVWLDPAVQDPHVLQELIKPYDAEELQAYPASEAVNSPKNNGAELIREIG
ncbi:SOS response-associated peptidase [Planococcus sp. ISL-109]|uniref:SOS response-associated peptidase n=1 Tax=Planococcus sp. ISL-109 TaxID=2819166 RepID=UPI001BE6E6B5|nr:SOS response-associated peptidase [Planococcus sp. ISL-109]MBT2583534.1 SOS response-associated peptidase [Planococcus sp. ISL-109]